MPRAVQQLKQTLDGLHGRIVRILAERGHDLGLLPGDLVLEQRRAPQYVDDDVENRVEVFGETGAAYREGMAVDARRKRDAAAVERIGQIVRRSPLGAAIDGLGKQVGQTRRIRRLVHDASAT